MWYNHTVIEKSNHRPSGPIMEMILKKDAHYESKKARKDIQEKEKGKGKRKKEKLCLSLLPGKKKSALCSLEKGQCGKI